MRNLIWILGVYAAMLTGGRAAVVSGDDFNGNTDKAVGVLQHWYNTGNGQWDSTGWWNAANCLDAVESAIIANNGTKYLNVISNTFAQASGGNFINYYYDDEGWWAEAWIRAYDLTGDPRYLDMAKTIFSDIASGWSSTCNGGVWWSKANSYKNAIPNELFLLVAIRLHQRTPGDGGPGSYLEWATNEWAWFQASGMINGLSLVNDGLNGNCQNNGQTTWTYNQGVIVAGLTELYRSTGDTNYLAQAEAIADAAVAYLSSAGKVLQEPCEVQGGCGGGDVPQFKGIFARSLACLYDVDHKPAYFNLLFNSAHSIWFSSRNYLLQFGLKWTGPFDAADAARQSSAIMPISALAEPATAFLPFVKGAGSPAFNHAVGGPTGTLAWACSPATATVPGLMLSGPFITTLLPGKHMVHFRLGVDALSAAPTNLVTISVLENGATRTVFNVAWNAFTHANVAQEFLVPFNSSITGGALEFRVYWNNVAGAPTLTVSDVSVDGAHNWTAANLDHDLGHLDGANNWQADAARDLNSGYLVRGPGTAEWGEGNYVARFELKVDNFNWDTATVATLSVVDADTGTIAASRDIARNEFPNVLYQTFSLYFHARPGAHYDFRTYWHAGANAPALTQRSLMVTPAGGADFQPLALAAGSYNVDMVVEKTAAQPPTEATTASMDAGSANTGDTWYEQGYNTSAPTTGFPLAGSTITSPFASDHDYTLAATYAGPNAACVDTTHTANLRPVVAGSYSAVSFLTASGHGPVTVNYRMDYQDGHAESGAFSSRDWFNNSPVIWNAQGRVTLSSGAFNNVNNNNPRLYAVDVALTNTTAVLTNINLSLGGGNGVAAIFAVSGVAAPSQPPVPLTLSPVEDSLILAWPYGMLLQSTNILGPWQTNLNAVSPFLLLPTETGMFYRLQTQ
ncbi:MAG TPA: glycoside hydrolase family 76 protein [Dongiaceae bacterium]|nr:glycoside hydrolase family 76 protein [Dongiaceae bacterium]